MHTRKILLRVIITHHFYNISKDKEIHVFRQLRAFAKHRQKRDNN